MKTIVVSCLTSNNLHPIIHGSSCGPTGLMVPNAAIQPLGYLDRFLFFPTSSPSQSVSPNALNVHTHTHTNVPSPFLPPSPPSALSLSLSRLPSPPLPRGLHKYHFILRSR